MVLPQCLFLSRHSLAPPSPNDGSGLRCTGGVLCRVGGKTRPDLPEIWWENYTGCIKRTST